jgi:hypothetical protein
LSQRWPSHIQKLIAIVTLEDMEEDSVAMAVAMEATVVAMEAMEATEVMGVAKVAAGDDRP